MFVAMDMPMGTSSAVVAVLDIKFVSTRAIKKTAVKSTKGDA
jgi:hypothetical protein